MNKHAILTVFWVLLLLGQSHGQQYKAVKLFKNSLTITLPQGYRQLTDVEKIAINPGGKVGKELLFGDGTSGMVITLEVSDIAVSTDELVAGKDEYFDAKKKREGVVWLGDGVQTINGKKFITCTFAKSSGNGKATWTRLFIGSLKGKLFSGAVIIAQEVAENLKAQADAIIASVRML